MVEAFYLRGRGDLGREEDSCLSLDCEVLLCLSLFMDDNLNYSEQIAKHSSIDMMRQIS